ncbi:MAG: hypothetical protein WBS24_16145 [Terriglobales bacterium]
MSLSSHATSMFLWWAQPVLQSVVAGVLWRRKAHKQFPVFFIYLWAQVANFAVLYPLSLQIAYYNWYFWLYWVGQAVTAVLGFKVLHEIFLDVFRPYHALKDLGTPVFKWAGAVMLLVSVVVAASGSFNQNPITHAVTTLERSVSTVQVGLVLFLIIFAGFLGVSRKQLCFGIGLGFGSAACADLILYALYAGKFIASNHRLNLLNMFFFDSSILVWLAYGLLGTTVREAAANPLRTQRWERGLADLRPAATGDSLIPMFEGMVERAFSRSSNFEPDDHPPTTTSEDPARAKSAAAGSKNRI